MTAFPDIRPLSEKALAVTFGPDIDPDVHGRVLDLADWLYESPFPGLLAAVPAYASLTVHLDPLRVRAAWPGAVSPVRAVCIWLEKQLPVIPQGVREMTEPIDIPVRYGGADGPDLGEVAARTKMEESEVVRLHSETVYMVYMIGFLPGFPYLGILPPALELPRRDTPRTRVPAGSVAIAGRQTGIYPQSSPGGWHLIGRTTVQLFDSQRKPPALLAPGKRVRFIPVPA